MNFLRTYLAIGSVVAALRIIITIIATVVTPLKEAVNKHTPITEWLMNRPWIQALNCLLSIVTWPLDVVYITARTIRYAILRRNMKKNIELMTEIFKEEDEES